MITFIVSNRQCRYHTVVTSDTLKHIPKLKQHSLINRRVGVIEVLTLPNKKLPGQYIYIRQPKWYNGDHYLPWVVIFCPAVIPPVGGVGVVTFYYPGWLTG